MKLYLALLLLALIPEQVFLLPINDEKNNNINMANLPNEETAGQTLNTDITVQEDSKQYNAWVDEHEQEYDDQNAEADEQNSETTEQNFEATEQNASPTEQNYEDNVPNYFVTDENFVEIENHNEHNKVKSAEEIADFLDRPNSYESTQVSNGIAANQPDDDIDAARPADGQAVLVRERRNRHRGHAHYRGRDKKIKKKKKKNNRRTGKNRKRAKDRLVVRRIQHLYLPNKEE